MRQAVQHNFAAYHGQSDAENMRRGFSGGKIQRDSGKTLLIRQKLNKPLADFADFFRIFIKTLEPGFCRRAESGYTDNVFRSGTHSALLSAAEYYRRESFPLDYIRTYPERADAL